MALRPSLSFLRIGSISSPHTLELYLDTNCPFSAKLVNSVDSNIVPLVREGGKLHEKLSLIVRLQPQPWHGTSTYLHEAALAFGVLAPEAFWDYLKVLFVHQEEFFDRPTADLSSTQIRSKLAELAAPLLASSSTTTPRPNATAAAFLDKLTFKSTPNGGVDVTDDLKYNIKLGRQNGIHVTPTVLLDGLIEGSISSSWGKEEWEKFFVERITV